MRKKNLNVVAMIPVRMGSTRLRAKNLALIGGKPLVYYAIKAAKDSGVFDRIVVNGEHEVFAGIAKRYGVDYYRRPERLASSSAKSDQVVYDFMKHNRSDAVAWVNTIAPLQTGADVRGAVARFIEEGLDSMITARDEQVHCFYKGRPVNFSMRGLFARTQELTPVQPLVYSVMMWRTVPFIREFEEKGCSFFCGNFGLHPVGRLSAFIIKTEDDLLLAEGVMRVINRRGGYAVKYDVAHSPKERTGRG